MVELIARSETFSRFESYTRELQEKIVAGLGELEVAPFLMKEWTREQGGGGRMATVRGEVIEKGAVLVSSVHGSNNPITGKPFRAAGLSLIIHPRNPNAASVHMNVRRFEEEGDAWWGGGADISPMGAQHADDVEHFHGALKDALAERYQRGCAEADKYFFVPHRHRPRGAGGVFYDQERNADDRLVRALGDTFLAAYRPILARRARMAFTEEDRTRQLRERGIYVEFNLLWDRGTRFGFQSGGNPEAILASLPPVASW